MPFPGRVSLLSSPGMPQPRGRQICCSHSGQTSKPGCSIHAVPLSNQASKWARYDQLIVQQQPAQDGEKTSQPTPWAHAASARGRPTRNRNPAGMVRPQPSMATTHTTPLLELSGTGGPGPGWGMVSMLPLPHNHPSKFCWRVSSAWKEPNLNYSRGKETQNLVFRLIPRLPP